VVNGERLKSVSHRSSGVRLPFPALISLPPVGFFRLPSFTNPNVCTIKLPQFLAFFIRLLTV
jgi:hypothetical protein